jgi:genome maintenance exonuclease 1
VIADFDGVLSVIDFKTALREKNEKYIQDHFEQACAYGEMYEERLGRRLEQIVIIIMVDHLDLPQVFVRNKKDYLEALKKKIERFYKECY